MGSHVHEISLSKSIYSQQILLHSIFFSSSSCNSYNSLCGKCLKFSFSVFSGIPICSCCRDRFSEYQVNFRMMQHALVQITRFHLFVVHTSLPGKEELMWPWESHAAQLSLSVLLLGFRLCTSEKDFSCTETIYSSLFPLKLGLCFFYIFYCI